MAGIKVTLNDRGIGALLKSDGVRAELTKRAEQVLAQARSTAPVKTGAYRDGLHIEQDTTDRAAVRVKGGTDHDWIVEIKTGNLARALDAGR
jgi:hypothetical protein